MKECRLDIADWSTIAIGDSNADRVVVVLHGRSMCAADLAPFAHSLGLDAYFLFPEAPLPVDPRGFSWWPVDSEERARRLMAGPADLFELDPPGRERARSGLQAFVSACRKDRPLTLIAFSQGGMLAMDSVLHGLRPTALALISSSRIAWHDWIPRLTQLAHLPILISHGRADAELAFAAGEALRDAAILGGAKVTWIAHDGGHEIPLLVWRALKRFINDQTIAL